MWVMTREREREKGEVSFHFPYPGEHLSAEKPLPFILPKSVGERKTLCTLLFAENDHQKGTRSCH